jgi:endo-alpha-N-acetylgalactosaminidase
MMFTKCLEFLCVALALLAARGELDAAIPTTIESEILAVQIDPLFPRVIDYRWKAGNGLLQGSAETLAQIRINQTDYMPKVKFEKRSADTAVYLLEVPEMEIVLEVALQVTGGALNFTIPKISGEGETKVMSIAFPRHHLVSVRSSEPEAAVAVARTGIGENQKELFEKAADMKVAAQPEGWTYALVNNAKLAASIYNNVLLDTQRLYVQTTERDGVKTCGVWCPVWTWREVPAERFEMPMAKVVITTDRNGDGTVDWQDAALAYRDACQPWPGADWVPDRCVSQIAMNFASWAQHPFLRCLDAMKKIYLYTDGLNQEMQFKGYQSEGHDSAHPDYGGNVNRHAGGAEEMNFVMKRGKDFNVHSGIHINATEYYPEAKHYEADLVDTNKHGWAWLDQSYLTDLRYDITSGKLYARLDEMRKDLPQLDWIYVDVYWGEGWNAWKLAHKINSLGLPVYTEFEGQMERYVSWNHRSQDWTQQVWGDGLNGKIARFIQNHQKDVWTHSPLLRGSQNDGFMGWHSQRDLKAFIRSVFTVNLPSKYLQHFPLMKMTDSSADFSDGVRAVIEDGKSKIYRNGKLLNVAVYKKDHEPPQENLIFIPWEPAKPAKVYHWNDKGGISTWELPNEWNGATSVKLYQLTDLGRAFVKNVPVESGKISLDVKANTPYVVYKDEPPQSPEIEWGEGSPVKDPGFDSHGNQWWHWLATLSKDEAYMINDEKGQSYLRLSGNKGEPIVASQEITLKPGQWYSASVWVEITGNRSATLSVSHFPQKTLAETTIDKTDFPNYSDNSDKFLSRYQRIKVVFQMPSAAKNTVTINLIANQGDPAALIGFDDVRVVKTVKPDPRNHAFFEDFENADEGWGPFVYGYQGNMRTHLSEKHEPFTNDTIDGRFSLKTFDEADGLNFRSLPALLKFKPNTKYRLAFDYLTQNDAQYEVVVRRDESGEKAECLAKLLPGKDMRHQAFAAEFTTGPYGDYYVGFVKKPIKNADDAPQDKTQPKRDHRAVLAIDNFAVDQGPEGSVSPRE